MTFTTAHLSVSLDGFVAGPDQSREDPLGRGGFSLHHWHVGDDLHPVDRAWTERLLRPRGAYVMGRNMFGPVRGPWESQEGWRGWWGDEPPYHAPVFVLTRYARPPLEMEGGTTFHFVTGGLPEALAARPCGRRRRRRHRGGRLGGAPGAGGRRARRADPRPHPGGAGSRRAAAHPRPRGRRARAGRGRGLPRRGPRPLPGPAR